MRCLSCDGYMSNETESYCTTCYNARPPSLLKPIGPLARLLEETSLEDYILFCIALNRSGRLHA